MFYLCNMVLGMKNKVKYKSFFLSSLIRYVEYKYFYLISRWWLVEQRIIVAIQTAKKKIL